MTMTKTTSLLLLLLLAAAIPSTVSLLAGNPAPRRTALKISSPRIHTLRQSALSDQESPDDDPDETSAKEELTQRKQEVEAALNRLMNLRRTLLESDLSSSSSSPMMAATAETSLEETSSSSSLQELEQAVHQLEREMNELDSATNSLMMDLPPEGLSREDYAAACAYYFTIPRSIRWAWCEALELPNAAQVACDRRRIPEIVALLYQQRIQLTPQKLRDSLKSVQAKQKRDTKSVTFVVGDNNRIESVEIKDSEKGTSSSMKLKESNGWSQLFPEEDERTDEERRMENTVNNVLGRITRKEGVVATQQDLNLLLKVLNDSKDIFVPASTQAIPGGFVVRGKNAKATEAELVSAIDTKMPEDYQAQVSYMADITNPDSAAWGDNSEPVLVLLNKDFSPRTRWYLFSLCSLVAVVTALLFSVGVYGSNDLVTARLTDATSVGDAGDITWFNDKINDIMLPLFAIQGLHELGHFIVAKANKMETSFPTLLPFWSLPFMGAQTQLRTSPPNRSALFDFGFLGPTLGLMASLACLVYGLQLTATADASTVQYFPALPVSLLKLSTLGGTMVDYFLGGGDLTSGFITLQDPSTPIQMHPLAVVGFTSLLMNALSLLPLGSTDGGRMSLALFGRYGHTLVGAAVWLAVLFSSFTLERVDVLIGAWLIYNFLQNDMEIPCREEISEVSIPRALAGLSVWFVALLTFVPMS